MAMAFDSKFIDTSCVLKHNVDELLVGLTKQILLRQAQDIVGSRGKVLKSSSIFKSLIWVAEGEGQQIFIFQDVNEGSGGTDGNV